MEDFLAPPDSPAQGTAFQMQNIQTEPLITHLQTALNSVNAGSWQWDAVADRAWWDARYCEMYGFAAQDVPDHQSWIQYVASEDRARIDARLKALLNTPGDDLWHEEYCIIHPTRG
jgi:PAS domain-containing protein